MDVFVGKNKIGVRFLAGATTKQKPDPQLLEKSITSYSNENWTYPIFVWEEHNQFTVQSKKDTLAMLERMPRRNLSPTGECDEYVDYGVLIYRIDDDFIGLNNESHQLEKVSIDNHFFNNFSKTDFFR